MSFSPSIRRATRVVALAVGVVLAARSVPAQDAVPVRTTAGAEAADTGVQAWKQVFDNVARDQKDVVLFPEHLDGHWLPFVSLAAATAGLVALDPAAAPKFRATHAFNGFNHVATGLNTSLAMAAVPAAFYLARSKAHDSYGKETVWLAAEAVADVQILTFAAKMLDRRLRPSDVPPGGDYDDTWFRAHALGGKSFPSGHTITAFALAEVFAKRYPRHRWVPWLAYGLAATVGFSRVTLQAHFPSDVFAGGALGIVMTDGLVLRRPH